jgi:hypothetical protein
MNTVQKTKHAFIYEPCEGEMIKDAESGIMPKMDVSTTIYVKVKLSL